MASLRDLLNIETAADLAGQAGAVPGKQWVAQVTCQQCQFDAYGDWCCNVFIVPSGTSEIIFDVWGGGGGGGRSACCGAGGPGGSGAWARKCINSEQFSIGDCYRVTVGRATYCSQDQTGCAGNYSCVCSVENNFVRVCAEGGGRGCWYCFADCCTTNAYCTCEQKCAYGGDINVKGHPGCFWHRCLEDHCYDKIGFAYPGGLNNKCGGVVWTQVCCKYAHGAALQNYAISILGSTVGSQYCCNGYMPGVGGGTMPTEDGVCRCGLQGTPGLVRVTYR